ncbi:hypothetical protein D3C81_1928840 [compost metagenome]
MYGITFNAKTAIRSTAPPENMLNMSRMPRWPSGFWKKARKASELMPGIGT